LISEIKNSFSVSDNSIGYTGKAWHLQYMQGCNKTTFQYFCADCMNTTADSLGGSQENLLLHAL